MLFELIPATDRIYVEGQSESPAVGTFRGVVLAIGLRGSDPVAAAAPEEGASQSETEGLLGWGTTYFLVADTGKPAPIWVEKGDITSHRIADSEPSAAARA